jgi:NADPH:quinone reductase-like Zn-dependent oxidoreductase
MPKMRAVQVPYAGGPFEIVERDIPVPDSGMVRVKVQACGICHSDEVTKEGQLPGIQYPRVPGHEVVGLIDAVGANVPPRGRDEGGDRRARADRDAHDRRRRTIVGSARPAIVVEVTAGQGLVLRNVPRFPGDPWI